MPITKSIFIFTFENRLILQCFIHAINLKKTISFKYNQYLLKNILWKVFYYKSILQKNILLSIFGQISNFFYYNVTYCLIYYVIFHIVYKTNYFINNYCKKHKQKPKKCNFIVHKLLTSPHTWVCGGTSTPFTRCRRETYCRILMALAKNIPIIANFFQVTKPEYSLSQFS